MTLPIGFIALDRPQAKLLSEALTQYIDNSSAPEDWTLEQQLMIETAQKLLDHVNTYLVSALVESL